MDLMENYDDDDVFFESDDPNIYQVRVYIITKDLILLLLLTVSLKSCFGFFFWGGAHIK